MTIIKAALFSASLLISGAAFGAVTCLIPPAPPSISGTDAWAEVINRMAKNDNLKLSLECFVDMKALFLTAHPQACANSINDQIKARYGEISDKILTSFEKIGAIKLPSPLVCTGSHSPKTSPAVTTDEFAIGYRIASPGGEKVNYKEQAALTKLLKVRYGVKEDAELAEAIPRLTLGRGSAAEYQLAVTKLACLYPADFSTPEKAHAMLEKNGLGIDCAGAVQLMLHDSTGVAENADLGLHYIGDEAFLKDEMRVRAAKNQFKFSADPLTMRPGDIVPLEAPDKSVGHVVTVQNVHFEVAETPGIGKIGDTLFKIQVASSWGKDATGIHVGPKIETWVYDMQNKRWATQVDPNDPNTLTLTPFGPYNHLYSGQYRSEKLP